MRREMKIRWRLVLLNISEHRWEWYLILGMLEGMGWLHHIGLLSPFVPDLSEKLNWLQTEIKFCLKSIPEVEPANRLCPYRFLRFSSFPGTQVDTSGKASLTAFYASRLSLNAAAIRYPGVSVVNDRPRSRPPRPILEACCQKFYKTITISLPEGYNLQMHK